ncbi:uncharacterized protein B0I36DRAFT_379762 [Microdochium trichocladiopsis]|uniref:LysM domain-containing protein n=1 Tax=Microdochium trichocladiopsis TaxID=1682393 RepID=A0A9P8YIH3_9PEZI|nr:uncharacterized protein B0I36DRAFT_379762 [Microdochium trichocladiopsis]KAH7040895.1 hypothetical protein B0I36DRAFT_379762 [Microdochium trichocladiopsis]
MPEEWGISRQDFLAWNPSITATCGNYITGRSYCVEAPSVTPPEGPSSQSSTTTTATTTASPTGPTNGIETPQPIQPGMTQDCDRFYFVKLGDTCAGIASQFGISQQQFQQWNPAVGSTCTGIWADTYACVHVVGLQTSKTTSKPTTTSTPGNGIQTPQPTQPQIVSNCDKFVLVQAGETCATIAAKNGITEQQFAAWNPSVGSTCTGLWANAYACVHIIGLATTTKATSTTSAGNGIQTPQPTQPSMVTNCAKFHKVSSGQTCARIAADAGITVSRLRTWNKSLSAACTELWANAYVCIGTIGFAPSTKATCSTSDKTWGDNKAAAVSNVAKWCDGNSNTDGSGGFATGQTKYGCYNAPYGTNKIEFWARNDFTIGTSLSVAKCNDIVKVPINSCARGGTAVQEGWWVKALITAGKC